MIMNEADRWSFGHSVFPAIAKELSGYEYPPPPLPGFILCCLYFHRASGFDSYEYAAGNKYEVIIRVPRGAGIGTPDRDGAPAHARPSNKNNSAGR